LIGRGHHLSMPQVSDKPMYGEHADYIVDIPAPNERVFHWLDDQTRLSQHMNKRSWKMGWGKMETVLDELGGRALGSHIAISGRILGIALHLDEVVIRHEPPLAKFWETVGEPRLLVIGRYRMGFELVAIDAGTRLRVTIDYQLPVKGVSRLLGRLFGRSYAKWCVRQMAGDAQRALVG
jgi:hypothetical protein